MGRPLFHVTRFVPKAESNVSEIFSAPGQSRSERQETAGNHPERQEPAGERKARALHPYRARLKTKRGFGRAQEGEDNLNPSSSTTNSAASGWIGSSWRGAAERGLKSIERAQRSHTCGAQRKEAIQSPRAERS